LLKLEPSDMESLAQHNTRPKVQDIRNWLRKSEQLAKLLSRYNDNVSLAQITKQQETVRDILSAMGLDEKGKDKIREWILSLTRSYHFFFSFSLHVSSPFTSRTDWTAPRGAQVFGNA
jgi:hypothetical protein